MMKKICLTAIILVLIFPAVCCGKLKNGSLNTRESAGSALRQETEPEKAGSNGSFGQIKVNVDGEWVDIHGEDETRAKMGQRDLEDQDEEIRWGSWFDWIRRSN